MKEADLEEARQGKKSTSKQLFFTLLLFFIVLITGFSFIISPAFSVGNIIVEGNKYLTEEELYQIAGVPEKINIFRLNTTELKTRLYKDLRIEEADISRRFPSTIVLKITERTPLAYVACDYGFVEIDKKGTVLAAYKTIKNIRVPMITGITLHNLYVGDTVDHVVLLKVLEYLSYMDETAVNQMSEVNVAVPEELVAYTTSSVQIRIGKAERLSEKAKLTQGFLEELKKTKLSIEYIDFNFASPFIKFKK